MLSDEDGAGGGDAKSDIPVLDFYCSILAGSIAEAMQDRCRGKGVRSIVLIEKNSAMLYRDPESGMTALAAAAASAAPAAESESNRGSAARRLLSLGADPTAADFKGRTPLHLARTEGVAAAILEREGEIDCLLTVYHSYSLIGSFVPPLNVRCGCGLPALRRGL